MNIPYSQTERFINGCESVLNVQFTIYYLIKCLIGAGFLMTNVILVTE